MGVHHVAHGFVAFHDQDVIAVPSLATTVFVRSKNRLTPAVTGVVQFFTALLMSNDPLNQKPKRSSVADGLYLIPYWVKGWNPWVYILLFFVVAWAVVFFSN